MEFEAPLAKHGENDLQASKSDRNDIFSSAKAPIKIKPPFPQQLRKKYDNAKF